MAVKQEFDVLENIPGKLAFIGMRQFQSSLHLPIDLSSSIQGGLSSGMGADPDALPGVSGGGAGTGGIVPGVNCLGRRLQLSNPSLNTSRHLVAATLTTPTFTAVVT